MLHALRRGVQMIDCVSKIAIIFSVIGVICMYFISILSFPPLVPLGEVHIHEGSVVRVRGFVDDIGITRAGNAILTLVNCSDSIRIFVYDAKRSFDLRRGDEVEVEGTVVFRGDYEISTTIERIRRVEESACIVFSVSQIASEPLKFMGRRIRVSGFVCRLYKRVLYLCDNSSGVGMLRVIKQEEKEISVGERVDVEGYLTYDPEGMRYEFIATSFVR